MSSGEKKPKRRPVKAQPLDASQDLIAYGVDNGVTVTQSAILDERGIDASNKLAWRRALGNEYVFNPRGVSLADLADRPDLGNIPLPLIQNWCRRDGWVAKRKRFGELIQQRVERELANEVGRSRLVEMRKLIQLQERLEAKVDKALSEQELKSLETGINVLLKLGDRIDLRREQIQSIFPVNSGINIADPEQPSGETNATLDPGPLLPKLTDNEAAIAARAVLRLRQEACDNESEQPNEPLPVAPRKKRPPKANGSENGA